MSAKLMLFVEECREMLAELESALLELETEPENIDGVHRIFRSLHTIKGSAALLGLEDVRELTNDLETLFDQVRSGRINCSPALVTLSFRYKDLINDYLRDPDQGLPLDQTNRILTELEHVLNGTNQAGFPERSAHPEPHQVRNGETDRFGPNASPDSGEMLPEAGTPCRSGVHDDINKDLRLYHLRYQPLNKPFAVLDPQDFLNQIRAIGQCTTMASAEHIPNLDSLEPGRCLTSWDVILRTGADAEMIRDIFLFLDDPGDVVDFQEIDADRAAEMQHAHARQTAALLSAARAATRSQTARKDLQPLVRAVPADLPESPEPTTCKPSSGFSPQTAMTRPPGGTSASDPAEPSSTPASQAAECKPISTGTGKTEEIASIRVSAPKLDDMVDLVGQLVIVQAQLKQIGSELHNPLLTSVSEEIERLSSDLRERTLSLRMLPIGSTFNRFRRLVRDLSSELGKEIELKTHGAETELDKTVIEKLSDPLVHILRNSIDHGIEAADVRRSHGKPAKGTISLSAMQSAGQVRIIIEDDGRGMEPDKIFAKALERGLVRAETRPSDRDTLQLVFHPGFSTAETITSVSGRGVGMDVVKRSLESLKGTVEVDSQPGQGTTIRIGLPLTLAIIEGLLVTMDAEYYVIPLSDVLECVEIQRGPVERDRVAKAYDVRGELLPCLILRNWYQLKTEGPEIEQVVVVQAGSRRVGLVVDNIVGQLQTVIKGLGRVFNGMKGLSGATIMGNGALALILDVASLVSELEAQETSGLSPGTNPPETNASRPNHRSH